MKTIFEIETAFEHLMSDITNSGGYNNFLSKWHNHFQELSYNFNTHLKIDSYYPDYDYLHSLFVNSKVINSNDLSKRARQTLKVINDTIWHRTITDTIGDALWLVERPSGHQQELLVEFYCKDIHLTTSLDDLIDMAVNHRNKAFKSYIHRLEKEYDRA